MAIRYIKGKGITGPSGDKVGYPTRGDDKTNLNPVATWVKQAKRGNRRAARTLQRWLRSQGYGVKVDGKWGKQTSSAYIYYKRGNSADKWESDRKKKAGNPVNRFNRTPLASNIPAGRPGAAKPKAKKKPAKGSGFSGALRAAQSATGGAGVGDAASKKLNVAQYARTLAGMQFDAPINDLKTLIARAGPTAAQNLQDIDSWYGNAQQLNTQAGQRAGDIYEQGADQQDAAIANLMGALGGGGNDANAALAATNLRDTGYQRALGAVEEQYHADMNPILASATASAKQREQRLNLQNLQDLQLQLAQQMGQRGQAEAAANFEGLKYNNELGQQGFQNSLAQLNAALGAQAAGLDMQVKQEQIASSRQQRTAAGKAAKGGFIQWAKLNPVERQQLLQLAVYKPTGARRSLSSAQNYLVSMGYAAGNSPTRNRAIVQALRSFYS